VQRVSIVDDGERVMEVIVEDKQLSLAIGKKGQNVRLAAKLTGWKIDIKSEEEKRREVEAQLGALEIGEPEEAPEAEAQPEASAETADVESGVETAEAEDSPSADAQSTDSPEQNDAARGSESTESEPAPEKVE
jgi:transcription termination/antitermination protein NusA